MAKGIFLFFLLVLASARAQFCDPELQIQQGDPYAYQERDRSSVNRCEGVYLQEVASSAISLTSFTTYYEEFDEATEALYLTWLSPTGAIATPIDHKVHLRAESQVFKLYYRMDTVWPPTDDSATNTDAPLFEWKANILTNLRIDKSGLGISAWLPVQFSSNTSDGAKREIYLPLSVSTSEEIKTSAEYSVVLMPSAKLSNISYQIFQTTQEGYATDDTVPFIVEGQNDEKQIVESVELEDDYSSGQPVKINFSLEADPGIYYLEIEVTRTNSKKSHLEIWFYHHGG